ncbi:MAG: DNA topoisomerase (ATP-hydrolyzing) subunit A [Sphaerochaetaceae bacterium]|nr:DNA topoisomerase (ATP-hydrolyzing) subunit A [Sphaerochaetaceae bacterium]
MEDNIGKIIQANITSEMKTSYLNYAMSVIVSRALPDVRDGLKPVHRRILFGMYDMGIRSTGAYKKCARIVGDVLGKYHPHGDASVYDALVRLAQDFSLRYPVVKPQGNFGSVDGDTAAAMRYTECKMSRIGELMLEDLDKETVDFGPNYDESLQEPLVLPAAFPFLLANGSSGIAVGMATNMAPHNLREITDAIAAQIDNPEITISELMQYIKGPDFPTYGIICGTAGIKEAFATGRGKIVMRGRYSIEENKTHDSIVFTEIPYQVNKAELVKKIDELRKTSLKDISVVRDESDRDGMRVVIELKKGAVPEIVVNHLFKDTPLETNFNVNNLALVDGKPELLNLKQLLHYFIKHRENVITRRTQFNLRKAKEREHVLFGLKTGLENIDAVIEIIKKAKDNDEACMSLCTAFALDDIQAKAIINMRLGRLSHLETSEILNELADIEAKIGYYTDLLSCEGKILQVVKEEAQNVGLTYGDARRTQIDPHEVGGAIDKDFIKKEEVVVVVSNKGFCKRVSAEEYRSQTRGGKGVKGASLRDEDFVEHLFVTSSHNKVMFITDSGRAFWMEVYEIPEGSKIGKGVNIKALLPKLEVNENITSIISFEDFDEDDYLLMATREGVLKRVTLNAFINGRKNGIRALYLNDGDVLQDCIMVKEDDEAMIVSRLGKGLRFACSSVRSMGRASFGVKGMRTSEEDMIVGLVKVDPANEILMLTSKGKGKRVAFAEFMAHGRSTGGQKIYRLTEDDYLVVALGVNDENDIVCITKNGITIRTHVEGISRQGRNASGVKVVTMKSDDDEIVAVSDTTRAEDEEDNPDSVAEVEDTSKTDETDK